MNDRNFYIDWEELQNQNKILYNYWNSVILDLNYLNIPKNDLTDFSKILDELNISIRYNNKNATLSNLLKLFNKLVIYSKELNYNNYSTILFSKYNLLLAYSVAESGNWTLTHDYILKSSEYIYKLINSMEINHYSQYNINQTYVAIKELENLINIRDLQTFYIKYIIAIKKLENI